MWRAERTLDVTDSFNVHLMMGRRFLLRLAHPPRGPKSRPRCPTVPHPIRGAMPAPPTVPPRATPSHLGTRRVRPPGSPRVAAPRPGGPSDGCGEGAGSAGFQVRQTLQTPQARTARPTSRTRRRSRITGAGVAGGPDNLANLASLEPLVGATRSRAKKNSETGPNRAHSRSREPYWGCLTVEEVEPAFAMSNVASFRTG